METVYDWVCVLIFAGLVVLLLQRSSMENPPDSLWAYLPPAIGCAAANYFGNEDSHIAAISILIGVGAYVWYVLKPGRL